LGFLLGYDPEIANQRLKILKFWKKYGFEATREAFGVSKHTLYRWQAKLEAAGGDPHSSPTPKAHFQEEEAVKLAEGNN